MGDGRGERLLPLAGALFGILLAIGIVAGGEPPDTTETPEKLVDFYDDGKLLLVVICLGLGAVLFMFFAAALRAHLRATGPEWLGTTVYAGCVVLTVALGLFASSQFALLNAADDKNLAVMQSLNYIDNNNFPPAVIGLCVIYLGLAWHIMRTASFPKWFGIISLVLGIGVLAGPVGIIAFLLFAPFSFVLSLLLYRSAPVPEAV